MKYSKILLVVSLIVIIIVLVFPPHKKVLEFFDYQNQIHYSKNIYFSFFWHNTHEIMVRTTLIISIFFLLLGFFIYLLSLKKDYNHEPIIWNKDHQYQLNKTTDKNLFDYDFHLNGLQNFYITDFECSECHDLIYKTQFEFPVGVDTEKNIQSVNRLFVCPQCKILISYAPGQKVEHENGFLLKERDHKSFIKLIKSINQIGSMTGKV